MTSPVYSFSVSNGCDIVERLQKLHSSGTAFSFIVRTALEQYYNTLVEDSERFPDCLPNWKRFKKLLRDANDEQLKEIDSKLRQLTRLLEATRMQRNGVIKC